MTSWDRLLEEKASRLLPHRLVKTNDRRWELRPSPSSYVVSAACLLLALILIPIILFSPADSHWADSGFTVVIVLASIAVGYWHRLSRAVFDKDQGSFQGGRGPLVIESNSSLNNFTPLDRIHALQILAIKPFYGKGLTNRELNLVLTDGSRIHLLDLANPDAIRGTASDLGTFLGKPVWEADRSDVMNVPAGDD